MKKIITVVLILALASIFLVACHKDTGDTVTVRVNEVTHSVFYAPLYVAINNGYFAEEGLTIELTNGGGSDKSMTAVMTGAADIGLMGPETAVYVKIGGSTNYPVVFGQLTKKDGSFLIGRNSGGNFNWNSLVGSEIIGGRPGGMPAMCLEYALNKCGIKNDVTINYDVDFTLITAAFEGGTGDYCTMFEPGATEYQNAGKGYIKASVGAAAGDVPYTCFMATNSYISKNPETVKSFMRAIIKAIDFVTNSADSVVAAALAPSFPSTSLEVLASSVASYKAIDAYMRTPVMEESQYNTLLDILEFCGKIDQRPLFGDIIDNSIATSLLAE